MCVERQESIELFLAMYVQTLRTILLQIRSSLIHGGTGIRQSATSLVNKWSISISAIRNPWLLADRLIPISSIAFRKMLVSLMLGELFLYGYTSADTQIEADIDSKITPGRGRFRINKTSLPKMIRLAMASHSRPGTDAGKPAPQNENHDFVARAFCSATALPAYLPPIRLQRIASDSAMSSRWLAIR